MHEEVSVKKGGAMKFFSLVGLVLLSACTVPAARQHMAAAEVSARQYHQANAEAQQCAARQDWECARYWQQVADSAQTNARLHWDTANAIQQQFGQQISNAFRDYEQQQTLRRAAQQPAPLQQPPVHCVQTGRFINCN